MRLTTVQRGALDHLRRAYMGPEEGEDEVTMNLPHRQYSVGMLFPPEALPAEGTNDEVSADVPDGDVEEEGTGVTLAEEWRPSSVAISFVTDGDSVGVDFSCGTYTVVQDDGPPRWSRTPHSAGDLVLSRGKAPRTLMMGEVPVEIGARWRDVQGDFLVTVHARVLSEPTGNDRQDIPHMLFQVGLAVTPSPGARILEYASTSSIGSDPESAELRLRYRGRKIYAVGHGMAADWECEAGVCTRAFLTPVPAFTVPAVEATGFDEGSIEAKALELAHLERTDENPEEVLRSLDAFVDAFAAWAREQRERAQTFGDESPVAVRIAERSLVAFDRMRESVDLLRNPAGRELRTAFALGMKAMRLQMRQAAVNQGRSEKRQRWRPFQLGFLLVSLASTVDARHEDRELVDLIWFPTGGGKTEAYLGLAAIEIFRRRLTHGLAGGGTAVITRYTLRLLTSQQFQRAAALICAMEKMRGEDTRVKGMAPFSIGLWVGNEVTPGSVKEARDARKRLLRARNPQEANQFQVESCPWCLTPLVPEVNDDREGEFGVRLVGKTLVLHCVAESCEFNDELPLSVIDDLLYEAPPTILLATVDKFARLQFKDEAGSLLGIGTSFEQPSMIIQDELHLLSGPLGTTVAVFDAVIRLLLSRSGAPPKIVASTATIRASDEQVRGLYGRDVALYPPSGLDDDRTFFSRPVESGEGRLYVGLMPQSISQPSAVVAASTPMLELPNALSHEASVVPGSVRRDDYWTLVMYHNSLRELGRTRTLVLDDVNGRLESRAERVGLSKRPVRDGGILELTSRRGAEELPNDLRVLGVSADTSEEAVDVVLSSNMLSVGIDIPRLALMLMVGQPKTTSEYIQATSRVGRGDTRGIVVTLFRSARARDRSHFETFRGYHEALYRSVEPTSVTPWSLASRERSLAGALVALIRHSFTPLAKNTKAGVFDLEDDRIRTAVEPLVERFLGYVSQADPLEAEETRQDVRRLLREWSDRAERARSSGENLYYDSRSKGQEALLKEFGQSREGWVVAHSMRSVETNVAVEVKEPQEEVRHGKDQA